MAKYSQWACYFNGFDEYVSIGNVLGFERTDAFSISAWYTAGPSTNKMLVAKMGEGSTYPGYYLALDHSFQLVFALYSDWTGGNRIEVRTNSAFNVGYHHVVVTYDGSSTAGGVTIYVDGSPVAMTSTYNSLSASTLTSADLEIGRRNTSTSHLNWGAGNIDDVGFWDKELTSGEVTWIYNGNCPRALDDIGAPSNLVGWWRMGDGDTYPTIADNSVNSNDGTMQNMDAGNFVRYSAGAQDGLLLDLPEPDLSSRFIARPGNFLLLDPGNPQMFILTYFLMRGWNTATADWEMWISQDVPDPVPPVGPCVNVTVASQWEEIE